MERDSKGRFLNGNSASAGASEGKTGRPPKEREERFYEITLKACTYSDWRAIVKKAVEQAKVGNTAARKFLADYIIGPPAQRLDLRGAFSGAVTLTIVREDELDGNTEEVAS